MKNIFPKYKQYELEQIEDKLDKHNKELLSKFILACSTTAGESKLKNIRRVLVKVFDVFEMPMDKINLEDLRQFLTILKQSDLAPATKNEIKKHFKRFIKEFYQDWSNKFKDLKDVKLENDVNQDKINAKTILTKDELEKMLRGAESLRYKAMIILFYETAGRPEEVYNLKWKDIDLEKKDVKLKSSKTGNVRTLPIQESILHLKRYKQEFPFENVSEQDFVFPSIKERKKPISKVLVCRYFKKLSLNKIGKECWPYLLRHTRLTELHKSLPPKIYEKYADHSIQMATRYSHLDDEDLKKVFNDVVYHVKEVTAEDKGRIAKLESDMKALKKLLLESAIGPHASKAEAARTKKKFEMYLAQNIK